ncbi:C2 domain-containing protein [Phanerochaete sordida]|uniref:C2 domain-containing protein n=1 Tax=Phanerochaete sordida TaxID=48140 RepID=A0A9P3G8Y5_9APHY|nr:C2 domain-containing protein [Phanerochaete sordida]
MSPKTKQAAIHALVRRSSDVALSVAGCHNTSIVVALEGITIRGIRERVFHQGPLNTYLKLSVDGKHSMTTDVAHDSLNPRWKFSTSAKLRVRASSTIKICLYRQHNIMQVLDDQKLGEFQAPLISFLKEDTEYRLSSRDSPTSTIQVKLALDYSATLEDVEFANAKRQLEKLWQMPSVHAVHAKGAKTLVLLSQAIRYLDKLMDLISGITELYPWCKLAWIFLLSVYKAFKSQVELDVDLRQLISELREALAQAQDCRAAASVPGASRTLHAVLQLVLEGAALIDEWVHTTSLKKPFKAVALGRRIRDCTGKLADLRSLMTVLTGTQHLADAILSGVGEVKQLLSELKHYAARPSGESLRLPLDHLPEEAESSEAPVALHGPAAKSSSDIFGCVGGAPPAYASTHDLLAGLSRPHITDRTSDVKVPFPTASPYGEESHAPAGPNVPRRRSEGQDLAVPAAW